jgi:purine-binding chemotaxis protein CheW
MDILKIRKKKAKEAKAATAADSDAAAADADHAAPSEPAARSKKKTKTTKKAASPRARSAAEPAPPAAPAVSTPPSTREPASTSAIDDDPLRDFLARYDDGAEDIDLDSERSEGESREETRRFLAFELAGEAYAASIMDIREILRVVALTEVPRAPIQILGVLSKRGVVMPVVDLAANLGLRDTVRGYDAAQRVLVVGDGDRVCGLRVDRVREVIRLREGEIEEVPASLGAHSAHQLRGLGRVRGQMYILLDVPAVLHGLAVTAGIETREELT